MYLGGLYLLHGFRLLGFAGEIFVRSPVVVVTGPGLGNRLEGSISVITNRQTNKGKQLTNMGPGLTNRPKE